MYIYIYIYTHTCSIEHVREETYCSTQASSDLAFPAWANSHAVGDRANKELALARPGGAVRCLATAYNANLRRNLHEPVSIL